MYFFLHFSYYNKKKYFSALRNIRQARLHSKMKQLKELVLESFPFKEGRLKTLLFHGDSKKAQAQDSIFTHFFSWYENSAKKKQIRLEVLKNWPFRISWILGWTLSLLQFQVFLIQEWIVSGILPKTFWSSSIISQSNAQDCIASTCSFENSSTK